MQFTPKEENKKTYQPYERNGPASKLHDISKILHLCLVIKLATLYGLKKVCQ